MIAGGQFLFGLGHIERRTVDFCKSGDQEDDHPNRLEHHEPDVFLRLDDLHHIGRTGQQDHPDEGKAKGDLITDHLGGGT